MTLRDWVSARHVRWWKTPSIGHQMVKSVPSLPGRFHVYRNCPAIIRGYFDESYDKIVYAFLRR